MSFPGVFCECEMNPFYVYILMSGFHVTNIIFKKQDIFIIPQIVLCIFPTNYLYCKALNQHDTLSVCMDLICPVQSFLPLVPFSRYDFLLEYSTSENICYIYSCCCHHISKQKEAVKLIFIKYFVESTIFRMISLCTLI
jgi:hypothetical protein